MLTIFFARNLLRGRLPFYRKNNTRGGGTSQIVDCATLKKPFIYNPESTFHKRVLFCDIKTPTMYYNMVFLFVKRFQSTEKRKDRRDEVTFFIFLHLFPPFPFLFSSFALHSTFRGYPVPITLFTLHYTHYSTI